MSVAFYGLRKRVVLGFSLMALGLGSCASVMPDEPVMAPPPPPDPSTSVLPDWRALIGEDDRNRYLNRAEAWNIALAQARDMGGSGDLKPLGALIDPDAGLRNPSIPEGNYRCRTVKLGTQQDGDLGYVVYGWFNCRVRRTDEGLRLTKLTGSQKVQGVFYPENDRHMMLLGAMALSNETTAPPYGAREDRDVAAYLERIGEQRWRLVTPWPRLESKLDILELVPSA